MEKICVICGIEHSKSGKTCSLTCKGLLISKSTKGKTGGARAGSGRAKTGYYKGNYCGSTYELAWVIYQIDHDVSFERFPGFVQYENRRYYPDFIQDGKIIEIKGFESVDSVSRKSIIANKNGYDVIVLRRDDLEHCFKWVIDKYKTDKFETLYDGYKPRYSLKCVSCQKYFETNNKKAKCCSRVCAGKMPLDVSTLNKLSAAGKKNNGKTYSRKEKYKWITNGITNTRILIEVSIPDGYRSGYARRK